MPTAKRYTKHMRVMEPVPKRKTKARSKKPRRALLFGTLIILILGGYLLSFHTKSGKRILGIDSESQATSSNSTNKPFRFFSGYDFQTIYQQTAYPNTSRPKPDESITGNTALDARIRQIAESRGYQKQASPKQPISDIQPNAEGMLLQPLAYDGAQKLLEQAKAENIPLTIQIGFVAYEQQRAEFLKQLGTLAATADQIAAGSFDSRITQVVESIAPPGYSRLQTGYGVVVGCGNTSGLFRNSTCHTWLKANNYAKAKHHGYIPSHSENVGTPETKNETQYVWVGTNNLY